MQVGLSYPTSTIWFILPDLDLKASKKEHSFIFPWTKVQAFQAKKEIVSLPHFIFLGTLLENSLSILRLYGEVLLILKTSPITVGESTYVYIFLLPKSGYFCGALRKCGIFHELGVELGQIDIQTRHRIKNNRTITKLSSRKDCLQVLRAKKRLTDLDGTTLNLPRATVKSSLTKVLVTITGGCGTSVNT